MGESRTDIVNWVNSLLQLNYTKIEQMGTGAAYCQIMDSIFGDVPLLKVKFDAKQEYEWVNNFKVLQEAFTRHKVDRAIPVDRLVKCKMQDNLEFSQWLKKYWESANSGAPYDAVARRKGAPGATTPAGAPATSAGGRPGSAPTAASAPARSSSASSTAKAASAHPPSAAASNSVSSKQVAGAAASVAPAAARAAPVRSATTPKRTVATAAAMPTPTASPARPPPQATDSELTTELRLTIETLEHERDFYFRKLREIEVLVQQFDAAEEGGEVVNEQLKDLTNELKKVLYSTEEGFVIPDADGEELLTDMVLQDEY